MITTILSDFSRVILEPKDPSYTGTLNGLYKKLLEEKSGFNFYNYYVFNDDLLTFYSSLKPKYSVNIFTTGIIQNAIEVQDKIKSVFDNIFSAADYGLSKKDASAYTFIANKLNTPADQIIYIDDKQENLNAAKNAGMDILLYNDLTKLQTQIKKIIAL